MVIYQYSGVIIIKNKKRFLLPILLAFLFVSVDLFTPGLINRFTAHNESSIVYAKPRTSSSGFKSGSFKSTTKSSSSGFKSGSFSTPKSSSSTKSSGSKSTTPNYSSGSGTKRSILPIPIPIPWGSNRYYGSGFGGIGSVGSFVGGIFRFLLIIIVIIIIFKIIKNRRKY